MHIMVVKKKKRSTLDDTVLWFEWLCCYFGIGNYLHNTQIGINRRFFGKLNCFIEDNK
jgi:hypothetical protein